MDQHWRPTTNHKQQRGPRMFTECLATTPWVFVVSNDREISEYETPKGFQRWAPKPIPMRLSIILPWVVREVCSTGMGFYSPCGSLEYTSTQGLPWMSPLKSLWTSWEHPWFLFSFRLIFVLSSNPPFKNTINIANQIIMGPLPCCK